MCHGVLLRKVAIAAEIRVSRVDSSPSRLLHGVGGSCAVSAERVTPLNRKYPSSLVALSDNCHNFVLRKIK